MIEFFDDPLAITQSRIELAFAQGEHVGADLEGLFFVGVLAFCRFVFGADAAAGLACKIDLPVEPALLNY